MAIDKARIQATKDLLASMVIEEIADDKGITEEQAVLDFLSSKTANLLYTDDEAKLWWDGPAAIADMYYNE